MYNALEIASYIINYSSEIGKPEINLKLQKLLYYAQCYFFCNFNIACFKDPLVHWRYGPVVEVVYRHYKENLDFPIKRKQEGRYELQFNMVNFTYRSIRSDVITIRAHIIFWMMLYYQFHSF